MDLKISNTKNDEKENQTALLKTIDVKSEDNKLLNEKRPNDTALTSGGLESIDQTNEETLKSEQRSTTPILVKQQAITGKCPMKLGNDSSFLNHSSEIASRSRKKKGVKLKYLLDESTCLDTLFQKSITVRISFQI